MCDLTGQCFREVWYLHYSPQALYFYFFILFFPPQISKLGGLQDNHGT